MTETRNQFSVHYTSKRFEIDSPGHSPLDHFFEDNDPRITITTDRWGEEVIIVGYQEPIDYPVNSPSLINIDQGMILGIRIRDHCLGAWHPQSINLDRLAPPLQSEKKPRQRMINLKHAKQPQASNPNPRRSSSN